MTKKSRSFSSRLTHRIVYAVFLTMGIIAIITFFTARNVMNAETEVRYYSIMHTINEKIEKELVEYVVATRNVRNEVEQHLGSPEAVMATLQEELRLNPNILGYGAAFEPYFYPQKGRWFEPYVINHGKDKPSELLQIGSAQHDYFKEEWYQRGLKSDQGIFMDPYYDDSGAKQMVVTYIQPIRDKEGRKVGVLGADISWDWLLKKVRVIEKKSNKTGMLDLEESDADTQFNTFIVSHNGHYILHDEENRIMNDNFFDNAVATPDTLDDYVCRQIKEGKKGTSYMKVDGQMSLVLYHAIDYTDWSMVVAVPMKNLRTPGYALGFILFGLILIGVQVVYWICRVYIRHSTKPLHFLAKSADEVAKGNFNTPLPTIRHNDEVRQLRDSFSNMQQSLASYIEQLKTTTAEKASMESELSIANKIQMAMLPSTFPERNDVRIYGSLKPAKAVGGDLFDFFFRDGKLFFCVGDVLGKGVSAAMLMTVTKSLFRAYSARNDKPEVIISRINQIMSDYSTDLFVTLFVGILELMSGKLRYCSAGHEPPVVIADDAVELPFLPAFPVGSFVDAHYQALEAVLEPGTILFLFTDGLNEAMNASNKMFKRERVYETARKAKADSNLSPLSLINRMHEAVEAFVGDAEQSDDMTMLAILRQDPTTITLKASKDDYPRMTAYIKTLAEDACLKSKEAGHLRLIIEEAIGNIIDYSGATKIILTATANDGYLSVTITDDGKPFNPTTVPDPNLDVPGLERKVGGLGVHYMRQMSDALEYRRENDMNILTIRKNL